MLVQSSQAFRRWASTAALVAAVLCFAGPLRREARAQLTWASDNAGNYSGGWSNGTDGGTGFGAWSFSTTQGSGFAGTFIGNPGSAGITNFGTQAFALYANPAGSGAAVTVTRPFDGAMGVGDSFSFQWAVNWDTDSATGNKGFNIFTGGTTQVLNVNQSGFPGPILVNSASSGLAYGTNPMTWTLTLASPTELVVTATPRTGGTSVAYTGTFAVAGGPDAVAFYASQMGGGDQRQPYFNTFSGYNSGTYASGGVRVESKGLTGGGSLTVGGSTTLVLTSAGNTYGGGSTINAGSTLQVGDGVASGSLPGNVANAGTLVFDPAGAAVFGGAISGAGAVIKQGIGSTTLTGNNTYAGPTTVSAGQLTMTTSSTLGGGITVAPGATLGVTLTAPGAQLSTQSLTLGSLAGLTIDLGAIGAGSTAPLNVVGAVTTSGAATINFTTTSFSVGSVPLFSYGSLSSFGDLVLGQKPAGVQATLFNNTATKTVELLISRTPRYWSGQVSGTPNGAWAVGGPANWTFVSGTAVTATVFADGDAAFFDDSAAGTTAVTLAGAVSPSAVTIDNPTKTYSFTGAGSISGSGGLTKQGAGTVTMSTANTYTGATTIAGGRFEVATLANGGAASPLGASSAAAGSLVLAGGTLAVTGAGAATTDRGFTVSAAGGGLEVTQAGGTATFSGGVAASGAFRKTGAGTLQLLGGTNALGTAGSFSAFAVDSGRLVLAGSGSTAAGQVNTVTGEMWVGGAAGGATLEMSNSTLGVTSWLSLDSGTGSSLTNSALSVGNLRIGYDGGATPSPAAGLAVVDSTLASAGETLVGNSAGSTGSLSLAGSSVLTSAGPVLLANGSSSSGSVVMAGSSVLTGSSYMAVGNFGNGSLTIRDTASVSVVGDFNAADLAGSSGTLVVEGGSLTAGQFYAGKNGPSTGTVTVSGGSIASAGDVTLAWKPSSTGDMTLSGGAVTAGGNLTIGGEGISTWTQTGGTASAVGTVFLARTGALSKGTVNVTNGVLAQTGSTGALVVGEQGEGTLSISGPGRVVVAGAGGLVISGGTTGYGYVTVDGGTLEVTRVQRGSGLGYLDINGGTLKAAANANANFMSGLDTVTLLPAGVTVDSSGQNITIGQALLDYGGGDAALTKTGAGMLTLTGSNTYGGLTTVSAGGLSIETSSGATGGYALADGTEFGVTRVGSASSQAVAAAFTMSGSATLNFDFGSLGSQPTPLFGVAGSLSAAGDVIVNVSNVTPLIGQFPLLAFGSRDGSGTYSLGSTTPGITASLVTSSSNTLDLLVSAISGRFWNGEVAGVPNGAWAAGTFNWLIPPTTATTFADGDEVVFNDLAAGTTAVTLAGAVSPSSTTIDNATKAYSFTGAGSISGSGGLVKLGVGTATMSTANAYTGVTTLGGGRFEVSTLAAGGVASPLGASGAAAANLVLSGGTLAITGAGARSTDRGFTVGAAGGGVEVTQAGATATFSGDVVAAGTLRTSGAGTLVLTGTANALGTAGSSAALAVEAGVLSLAGSGSTAAGQVNTVTGQVWVGGSAGGTLAMANSTLNVSSDTVVGNAAGSTGVLSLSGNSALTSLGPVLLANGSSSGGSMVVAGSSVLTGSSYMAVGNVGSGTLTVRDTASVSARYDINVADLPGSAGALVIEGGTVAASPVYIGKNAASVGTATVSGGNLASSQFITLASASNSIGGMTLSGGGVSAAGELTIGDAGAATWTQTGGTASAVGNVFLARAGAASSATASVSGGLLAQSGSTGALVVGEAGVATLTISGSGRVLVAGDGGLVLSGGTTGFGDVTLDGGTLEVTRVQQGAGDGSLKLNGGTLKAAANANPAFLEGLDSVDVQAGGAFIDSNGQSIAIAQSLPGSGGLTKLGAGTLSMSGNNSYAGPTTVSQGTLQLATATTLASSPMTVAAGATLAVGPQVAATVPTLVNNGLVDVGLGGLTVGSGQTAGGIVAAIVAGRDGGGWTGTSGITSSAAAAQSDRAVGWLDNGDGSFTVAFAAAGDLNVNGVVDFDDVLLFVSAGLFDTGLPATWIEGDYDYNGVVDFDDVLASVSAGLFDTGPYNAPAGSLAALGAGAFEAGFSGVAAVPEPATWVLVAVGAACAVGWRRRRR